MKAKARFTAVALSVVLISALAAPAVALAGGDQVHRPDGAAHLQGLKSEGQSPFAPREEQLRNSR